MREQEELLGWIDVGKDNKTIFITDLGWRQEMRISNELITTKLIIAKNHSCCTSLKSNKALFHSWRYTSQTNQYLALHLPWVNWSNHTESTTQRARMLCYHVVHSKSLNIINQWKSFNTSLNEIFKQNKLQAIHTHFQLMRLLLLLVQH